MKLSLITRLSSLVTLVHGHARFARQASSNEKCLDTSDQCETWKTMNLCNAAAVKVSCALTCDNCENISAQTQNAGAANNNNATSIDSGVCEDIIDGCINFSSQCDKINIRNGCRKTCNLCDTDTDIGNLVENQLCQDLLPACDLLTKRTSCSSPAMKASCALTCGTCKDILVPILNKISDESEIVATAATETTQKQDETTSASSTSKSDVLTAKSEETEDSSENNDEDVESVEKLEDNKSEEINKNNSDDISENVDNTTEINSDLEEASEVEESGDSEVIEPTEVSVSDSDSTSSITVVTTEQDSAAGSSTASSICLSVLVFLVTILVQ